MDQILEFISKADETQLTRILQAVIDRHGRLHPDWELTARSLPKSDPGEREQCIDRAAAMLKQEKFQA